MSLEAEFKAALAHTQAPAKPGKRALSNEEKLQFYALFKQISTGPNKTKEPSRLNFVKNMKWKAWSKLGNMSKDDAMRTYIKLLSQTDPEYASKVPADIRAKL